MHTLLLVSVSTSHMFELLRKGVGLGAIGRPLPGYEPEEKLYWDEDQLVRKREDDGVLVVVVGLR